MDHSLKDRLRLITSRQNSSVKELRRAFHAGTPTEDGYSAVEGMHLIEEAIRSGLRIKAAFFSQEVEDRAHKLLPQLAAQVETLLLPDDVFASAVLTDSPQGVAALVKLKSFKLDDVLRAENPLLIGVAGVQDPGNLGTILRSAEAFGANGALLGDRSVSPWNPKVIRGSSGSVFRLPVVRVEWNQVIGQLKERDIRTWATSSHRGEALPEVDFSGPSLVIVGSEGAGVSRELLAMVDGTLAIPHSPKVESLNAGIAASIVLYEASRQRNANG